MITFREGELSRIVEIMSRLRESIPATIGITFAINVCGDIHVSATGDDFKTYTQTFTPVDLLAVVYDSVLLDEFVSKASKAQRWEL